MSQRCATGAAAVAAVDTVVTETTAARATQHANSRSRARVFFWAVAMVARRLDMNQPMIKSWTKTRSNDVEYLQ